MSELCGCAGVSRQAYYQYRNRRKSENEIVNTKLVDAILEIYDDADGIYGYRQMTLTVNRKLSKKYNHKRIYRLMKILGIRSVTRRKKNEYVKTNPHHIADNILNRDFTASKANEKWVTDVTEFKYGNGKKSYLSAIMDLYDNSIVAFQFGHSNNNKLVFDTLKEAIKKNPKAEPLIHSDRGFQYTSYGFERMLKLQGMTQSMSRTGKCIDNGPMESYWGKIKSERYYLILKKEGYDTFEGLKKDIEDYIECYNNERPQKKCDGYTPIEYRMMAA
ncbi:IS3 family transposase [Wansuia hejianensis]|uniref:IS3 family transposase n=1 Tax=Wansuia hejianensis TaxID=2763667 RepID=UPI0020166C51